MEKIMEKIVAAEHETPTNIPVYMYARSESGPADWYGDYDYYTNPLEKYKSSSKLWTSKISYGSGRANGIESIAVKTTLYNLQQMGWEDDYKKYKSTEENFNQRR